MRRFILPALLLAFFLTPRAGYAKPAYSIPSGWPQSLSIPRLAVHAPIQSDPLTKQKPLDQQPKFTDVLWFSRGVKPGDQGHAVIFGHLDTYTGPATFWNLHTLVPGNKVTVAYKKGNLTFQIIWSHAYPDNKVPYKWIYGTDKHRGMVLVSCSGLFHGLNNGGYDHRLVVFARLVLPGGKLA